MISSDYAANAEASPLVALRSRTGAALIAATVLASGVASYDANVIKVAVPAIGRSLGAGVTALQWTLTSYLITVAALLLLSGALADRFGRRRMLTIGLVVMLVSSVLCAVVPSVGVLGVIVIAVVPVLIGASGGRSFGRALAHGYQPAMVVMGGLCAAAALITVLLVTDRRAAAPRIAPRAPEAGCASPVPAPATTS
jgi:MFS family permease